MFYWCVEICINFIRKKLFENMRRDDNMKYFVDWLIVCFVFYGEGCYGFGNYEFFGICGVFFILVRDIDVVVFDELKNGDICCIFLDMWLGLSEEKVWFW